MRDRRRMLWNGSVSVSVVLSLDGNLAHPPIVQQTGLAEGFKAEDYLAEASIRVEDAILAMRRENRFDDDRVMDIASQAARGWPRPCSSVGHLCRCMCCALMRLLRQGRNNDRQDQSYRHCCS